MGSDSAWDEWTVLGESVIRKDFPCSVYLSKLFEGRSMEWGWEASRVFTVFGNQVIKMNIYLKIVGSYLQEAWWVETQRLRN